jgi:hypothetical protein
VIARTKRSHPSPAAEITVFRDRRGWIVRFNARDYGPHPSRAAAVYAAVDAAKLADSFGRAVSVREVVGPARSQVLWPRSETIARRPSIA